MIRQARGILIERLKIAPDQAFAVLTGLSQEQHERLREVAHGLVGTGELPETRRD